MNPLKPRLLDLNSTTPESAPRPGRRERRSAETRERIFRAALSLFAARGFQATTIEDITEAADVGKGTFFNYFPSKEHVLAAFGKLQRSKIEQAVAAAQGGHEAMRNVLKRLVHAVAEEPGRSPALLRSILIAMLSNESVRETVAQNLELGRRRLEELVTIGQQRGEIRSDLPASDLSRVLQRSAFGTMLFWALRPTDPLAERLEVTFDVLLSGMAAKPASSLKEQRP